MKRNKTIKLNDVIESEAIDVFKDTSETFRELIGTMVESIMNNEDTRFLHKEIMVLKNLQYELEDVIALFDESDDTKVRNSSNTK